MKVKPTIVFALIALCAMAAAQPLRDRRAFQRKLKKAPTAVRMYVFDQIGYKPLTERIGDWHARLQQEFNSLLDQFTVPFPEEE